MLNIEKQQLYGERQEQIKQKTKLELVVSDLEDGVVEDENLKREGSEELKQLEATIRKEETELEKILPRYREKNSAEEDCQNR